MKKIKKWRLIEETDVSPSPWYPLFKHKVKLPDGKIVEDYYISKLGDVAMVIAITPEKEIIFARQYKHGVQKIIVELPAGRIEQRTPEQAAKEEIEEEIGIVPDKIEYLGRLVSVPSKDTTRVYVYLIRNARITKAQNLDETEEIEIVKIPIGEIDEKIISGEIRASDTIASINLARLKIPELFNV